MWGGKGEGGGIGGKEDLRREERGGVDGGRGTVRGGKAVYGHYPEPAQALVLFGEFPLWYWIFSLQLVGKLKLVMVYRPSTT